MTDGSGCTTGSITYDMPTVWAHFVISEVRPFCCFQKGDVARLQKYAACYIVHIERGNKSPLAHTVCGEALLHFLCGDAYVARHVHVPDEKRRKRDGCDEDKQARENARAQAVAAEKLGQAVAEGALAEKKAARYVKVAAKPAAA